MRNRRLLYFIMLILLIGCTSQAELPAPTQKYVVDTTPQSTPTVKKLVLPSPTALSATLVPTSSPSVGQVKPTVTTVTTDATQQVKQKCLQILSGFPQNKINTGKIVFTGKHQSLDGKATTNYVEVSLFNLKTGQISKISPYKPVDIRVSPDGGKYALTDITDTLVKVFSADGQLLKIIPKGTSPWFIDQWLDNQRIALVVADGFPTLNLHEIVYPRNVVIFDLLTNKQKLFPSDFPNIDKAQGMMWEGGGTTKYDITLTRVVYASLIDADYKGKGGQGYTLWDVVNNKKIVEFVNSRFQVTPKWSPDGSKFVFPGKNLDLFTITRDGLVARLTHLNPELQKKASGIWYYPEQYSWSPDGRFLALWIVSIENGQPSYGTFAVLDTSTGEVTDYCIHSGYIEPDTSSPLDSSYVPIWSPDGKYLVIKANNHQEGNFDTVLIDLEGGIASKMGENLVPAGWLETSKK